MNWSTIHILLEHELRVLIRDRRTVILSIILPVLLIPLMIGGMKISQEMREERHEETTYLYTVVGSEATSVRALIERGRARVDSVPPDDAFSELKTFKMQEYPVADPAVSLKEQEIHFYLEALSGAEADSIEALAAVQDTASAKTDTSGVAEPVRYPGVPVLNIYYQGNWDASRAGEDKIWDLIRLTRAADREVMLRSRNFFVDPKNVMAIETSNISTPEQETGSFLGRFLTNMMIILMLAGGSVAAMDSISGEKERGSLETLLTTAVRRTEIVTAKQLAILCVALTVTAIQVINILVYLSFEVIELPENFSIEVSPLMLILLFVLFAPVAAIVSSALLMVSAYAKTFKEAQLYYFPVFLVMVVLTSAAYLPGISLRSAVVLVPLANVSVAVREVMVGAYDWIMLGITVGVILATAGWMLRLSANMLSKERLITASEADEADLAGGAALYPKHALRWYAVFWAVMLVVAANIPALGELEAQLFFNEFVIFLGGPALIIRRYRLNIREALALRPVKPVVWPVVLLLIPAVQLTGTGVFFLANQIFPVPERMLEEFAKQILPEDIPAWRLFLYIAVIPGICEEIGFRGTLLYGLRRRFHPVILILVLGLIFGMFHTSLFRIIPTGFLGVVITAVAVMTGSIFPCMLLHAGSNGLAIWMSRQEMPISELAWGYYVVGVVVFIACLLLLYRYRTPYPGLKEKRHRPNSAR